MINLQQVSRLLLIISFTTLYISCGRGKSSGDSLAGDSARLIGFSESKPIPVAEIKRIRIACQQWYDSLFSGNMFNGGILVAKDGNIVFEKYNGTGHVGSTDTINAKTPNHIASVSKTFTAMAVLKLVQEAKVELDAEFSTYFPGFNYPGVTVRNLLNHRSGLPNYLYFMDVLKWDQKVAMTNQDVYDWMVKYKKNIRDVRPPDRNFSYCNTNYVMLALLIENTTGIPYPQYMRDSFFIPLQMNSTFVYTVADSLRANPSYDWKGGLIPFNYLDDVYGDKNIYSTPRDLLKWDRVLTSNVLFTPETFVQAYTPYSNEKPGVRNYGLGWRMNIYPNGKKIIFHNGWWHGSNAVFIRMPQTDVMIVVIGNKFTRNVYKAKYLLNILDSTFQNYVEDE